MSNHIYGVTAPSLCLKIAGLEESFAKYLPWNQEVKQELEEWEKKLLEN